ncbi:MAG TPA: hypothetical protein ENK83_05320 [Aliiroseovarius sp.]|nr:hypothetical protein [Aliiroseovarius sp.]
MQIRPSPARSRRSKEEGEKVAPGYPDVGHTDFVAAAAEVDTDVDIAEDDLLHIYHLATKRDSAVHRG